jgi:hypothetical protein
MSDVLFSSIVFDEERKRRLGGDLSLTSPEVFEKMDLLRFNLSSRGDFIF